MKENMKRKSMAKIKKNKIKLKVMKAYANIITFNIILNFSLHFLFWLIFFLFQLIVCVLFFFYKQLIKWKRKS